VLAVGGYVGWTQYDKSQARAAADLLEHAVETSQAEIRETPPPVPRSGHRKLTFPNEAARTRAALRAYRAVLQQFPRSDAAPWARLGEAEVLFRLGHQAQARRAYEQAQREGASNPEIVWRALEGKAFTFEAAEQWDRALAIYQELGRLDERHFEPIAKYHMARMYLAKGQRQQATETLRALVRQLNHSTENEEEQEFPYVLAQAQTRLRELDPSAAPPPPPSFGEGPLGGPGGMPDLNNLTPEQRDLIRRLMEQKQQQQGGGE
jgi:tetratricopeptide (TPR) repeat protein